MRKRLWARFDTAEARISRRLANQSSIDTLKGLLEKIAIEGSLSLFIGAGIFLIALILLWVSGEQTTVLQKFGLYGGIVGVVMLWILCEFGSADSYNQGDVDNRTREK